MKKEKYLVENSVRAYRDWKRSGVPCKLLVYDRECFKGIIWKDCTRVVATFDGINEYVSARCPYKKSQL